MRLLRSIFIHTQTVPRISQWDMPTMNTVSYCQQSFPAGPRIQTSEQSLLEIKRAHLSQTLISVNLIRNSLDKTVDKEHTVRLKSKVKSRRWSQFP